MARGKRNTEKGESMNQEIANFFVKFTSNGIAEVRNDISSLNEKVEDISKALEKSGKVNDGFFGKMKGWAGQLGLITAGFLSLRKAINEAFSAAQNVRSIYKLSDTLGVDPQTLERWEILAKMYDGDRGDVSGFFSSLNTLSRNMREGKYSDEMLERMARYGFTEQYLYGASLAENRDRIIGDLNRLLNRRNLDAADVDAIKQVFGLSDTMVDILKANPEALKRNLQWAEGQRAVTSDPEYVRQAAELRKTQIELNQALQKVWLELMPVLKEVLEAIKPLLEPLKELLAIFAELFAAIAPALQWLADAFGGGIGSLFDLVKVLRGKMTMGEYIEKQRNRKGVVGDVVRGAESVVESMTSQDVYVTARQSSEAIASGQYTMKDIWNVREWLATENAQSQMTQVQIDAMFARLKELETSFYSSGVPLGGMINQPTPGSGINGSVTGNLVIEVNGERFTQDASGNIFDPYGRNVGRAAWTLNSTK